MTNLEVHHDLALMLLVGRSLPTGIPWTLDEDQEHIERERALWNSLASDEQAWEQDFLAGLWQGDRTLPANPDWGDWADDLDSVPITDEAFGLPKNAYLPNPKGKPSKGIYPEFERVFDWAWGKGFQVVDVLSIAAFTLACPAHRVVQEAERLVALLQADFPDLSMHPFGHYEGGVQLRSCYDPLRKASVIEVFGLRDETLPA